MCYERGFKPVLLEVDVKMRELMLNVLIILSFL